MKYLILALSLLIATPVMGADETPSETKHVLIPEETIRQLAKDIAILRVLMEQFGVMIQEEYRKERDRVNEND